MTNRQIFIKAHKIAKETLSIAGDYRIAFKFALKVVYAELKCSMEQKLINLGCNVWEKYGKKRIYFNDAQLATVFGLVLTHYKTGSIKKAELNGEKISNNMAFKLTVSNPYFDCVTNSFVTSGLKAII